MNDLSASKKRATRSKNNIKRRIVSGSTVRSCERAAVRRGFVINKTSEAYVFDLFMKKMVEIYIRYTK